MIHKVNEPQIRAHLGTAAHFCEAVVLKLKEAILGMLGSWHKSVDAVFVY